MAKREPYPSEKQDRFIVRLPDGMRDRIKAFAEDNNRSMNAEIVMALEHWLEMVAPYQIRRDPNPPSQDLIDWHTAYDSADERPDDWEKDSRRFIDDVEGDIRKSINALLNLRRKIRGEVAHSANENHEES